MKSLVDLCVSTGIKNIKDIRDVGNLSYRLVRPLLLRIDKAEQLEAVEAASPHLRDDDAECWLRLINRDFPALKKERNYEPARPTGWRKVYRRYEREYAQRKKEADDRLKNAFASIKEQKLANTSDIVDFDRRTMPRPPRDLRGDARKSGAGGRRGGANDTGEMRWGGGSRTKVNTPQSIMRKVKREAKEVHNRTRLGAAVIRAGQVQSAPAGMREAVRISKQSAKVIRPPTMGRPPPGGTTDRAMQEREDRLRTLKGGQRATVIDESDSDEDNDQDDDDDDDEAGGLDEDDLEALFDDAPPTTRPTPAPTAKPALLPGKRGGLLPNPYRPSAVPKMMAPSSPNRPASKTSEQPSSRPRPGPAAPPAAKTALSPSPPQATTTSSPPPKTGGGGAARSPNLLPMPVKRKAPVSIFHQPRKVQRRT